MKHHHHVRVRVTLPFRYSKRDLMAYVREAVEIWQGQMSPDEPLRQAGAHGKIKVSVVGDPTAGDT